MIFESPTIQAGISSAAASLQPDVYTSQLRLRDLRLKTLSPSAAFALHMSSPVDDLFAYSCFSTLGLVPPCFRRELRLCYGLALRRFLAQRVHVIPHCAARLLVLLGRCDCDLERRRQNTTCCYTFPDVLFLFNGDALACRDLST